MYSDKVVLFGQKWLYSGKSGYDQPKVVVFKQSGCIQAVVVAFGQGGFIRENWLYSCKMVLFGQNWLFTGKSGCIRAKEVVVVNFILLG